MDKTHAPDLSGVVTQVPTKFRPVRSLLAVAAGVIVDLGGTNLVGGCYSLFIIAPMMQAMMAQGLSQAQMQDQLTQDLQKSISGSAVVIVLGIILSILGGWVAGRIARYGEIWHALAVGVGVTTLSVLATLLFHLPSTSAPQWQLALALVINWGANALGGYLALLQRTHSLRRATIQ